MYSDWGGDTSGLYLISNTDFLDECIASCKHGQKYCKLENVNYRCLEFKRKCRNYCPTSTYDFARGKIINFGIEDQCEMACVTGQLGCLKNN